METITFIRPNAIIFKNKYAMFAHFTVIECNVNNRC